MIQLVLVDHCYGQPGQASLWVYFGDFEKFDKHIDDLAEDTAALKICGPDEHKKVEVIGNRLLLMFHKLKIECRIGWFPDD